MTKSALPSSIARVYAMGEMDNWVVSVKWAEGPFTPRQKTYQRSIRLAFKKKNHPPAASVWLVAEDGKTAFDACYVQVRLFTEKSALILPYRLGTQKELLMYLTGETSVEKMQEMIIQRWIKPEEVRVDKDNCSGCTICQPKKWGKIVRNVAAADKEAGRPRRS